MYPSVGQKEAETEVAEVAARLPRLFEFRTNFHTVNWDGGLVNDYYFVDPFPNRVQQREKAVSLGPILRPKVEVISAFKG